MSKAIQPNYYPNFDIPQKFGSRILKQNLIILINLLMKNSEFNILKNVIRVHNKASKLATKLELGVFPIRVKIYQLDFNLYYFY